MTLEEQVRRFCHDVATPLSVVQGFLRSVESKGITEENLELMKAAKIGFEKLKGQIEELRRFALKSTGI